MIFNYYILDNRKAIPCDLLVWAKMFESQYCSVAKTDIKRSKLKVWLNKWLKIKKYEPCLVSTIFLGLNHNWGPGSPLIFETMVFGGKHDQEMDRYSTWEEAEEGHKKMCKVASK